jgi:hypothetical protein
MAALAKSLLRRGRPLRVPALGLFNADRTLRRRVMERLK